ncbi:ssDNA endodeoxyribonuclease RAD1 [Aspergillus clavatus NRRL 1]|uniref:DNA repair protein RAD1, putative n=1 Tax=Aspergillus clavatus (strain ATCC 1007 / CBS 513.65 / DSM 816 / NCTC 3887 / NRRL 1 / QM 1276 / 107) TaxID=344612 RepID=A1CMR5_ASPCL|nr:DNA repair protein RAD1, putative [Aspergillus clavatus NRRL 1]EAW08852.1 DNA repair protein RAD1, putative [Aspergillus clavatus NRRL 1]
MPPERANVPVKLSLPLQYQQDIFTELRTEDELVILARGLGLLRLVTNLLHFYDAAGNNLVLVVGADARENEWIGEALAEHYAISKTFMARGLKVINTERATVSMREKIYAEGGILSVTSRILVVDLLSKLLDPEKITGMVVLHAEKIIATSLEAFIIRVYRQNNKLGFLKAFSDSPEPFTTGFAPLANSLRNLFLRKTSLWPRFHVTVAESLEGNRKAEVIELEVPMTDKMREIQNAVLECVEISIAELKKANTGIDMADWTLDSALHRSFDIAIRRQLDPMWHLVGFRTRQIVSDLSDLRAILHALLTYDAVSFVKYLDTIVTAHSPPPGSTRHNHSPWLFLDAAHGLFQTAKSRVYEGKITSDATRTASGSLPSTLRPVLEEQPKWAVLAEILEEIEQDSYLNPMHADDSNSTVLIMCTDQRTCRQLREYLGTMHARIDKNEEDNTEHNDGFQDNRPSAQVMLRRRLREYLDWKTSLSNVNKNLSSKSDADTQAIKGQESPRTTGQRAPPNKRRRVRGGGAASSAPARVPNASVQTDTELPGEVTSLLNELQPTDVEEIQKEEIIIDDLEDMDNFFELYDMDDLVIVHPYDGDMDEQILDEVRPRYIIMYEPEPAFIRRVEVYRSSHVGRNVRVYFIYYGGSVEEQRYLSAVRREKDSFTKLIKEKGSMAVTLTHDKSQEDPQELFLRTVNTRIAGGGRLAATASPPRVVVDVREFRSALPSLLHGNNMVIVPCQLTVGDYILTPDICVERKSVRDLIASLKNGRLYNQAETMLQHYKNPLLLIEFDQNKSFTFDAFASSSMPGTSFLTDYGFSSSGTGTTTLSASSSLMNPSTPKSAQHLLVLLTLTFPRLKIVWSSSPYQTAEIFAELKKNNPEPDPIRAVQIGLDMDIAASSHPGDVMAAAGIEHRTFNALPQDMLRAVPGVTPKVLERLILETGNINEIANMDVEQLDPLVGREAARKIVGFFRKSVFETG